MYHNCTVPLATLTTSPFNLNRGDSIIVKVLATNFYGSSIMSIQGNGAMVVLIPDAPLSLQDNIAVTNSSQIGLTW